MPMFFLILGAVLGACLGNAKWGLPTEVLIAALGGAFFLFAFAGIWIGDGEQPAGRTLVSIILAAVLAGGIAFGLAGWVSGLGAFFTAGWSLFLTAKLLGL